jgi:hypothetical protein
MEINNIDKTVRDSMKSRTIQPSNSAWERLNDQLDIAQEKKRKNWFLYAGYAASVLLLISVAFFINTNDDIEPITPNTIVTAPIIDTTKLVKPTFKNTAPIESAIVKNGESKRVKKSQDNKKRATIRKKNRTDLKVPSVVKENSRIVIADVSPIINKEIKNSSKVSIEESRIKIDSDALLAEVTKSEIKTYSKPKRTIPEISKEVFNPNKININSDALLYAVTHTDEEVLEYYKKYQIDRNDVLKTIQKELKKANLKIDANILLAGVEKNIDEDTFKKSFMQAVKGKITGLASAFANRNN